MKILLQNIKTGKTYIDEIPYPSIRKKRILVENVYSAISIGTELMIVELSKMNYFQKAKKRPEDMQKILLKMRQEGLYDTLKSVFRKLEQPMTLGYSASGIVKEVSYDIDEFKAGDKVAIGGGGFVYHAEANLVPPTIAVKVPDNVKLEHAAFSTIASIGINAMRLSQCEAGDYVCIIGLGLIGLLSAAILNASGCNVYGIEPNENKRKLAEKIGVIKSVNNDFDNNTLFEMADGRGFDKVFIAASGKLPQLLMQAGEIARDRGTVCLIGDIPVEIPRKLYYTKELKFFISRSYGAGRYDKYYEDKAIDYPIGYVKWTEKRNMKFFIDLLANNKIDIEPIITDIYDFEKAESVYNTLKKNKENSIGILFRYKKHINSSNIIINKKEFKKHSKVIVGIIGAGNFVQATMLPYLSGIKDIQLKAIADTGGKNASFLSKKYDFVYSTSDYKRIINDNDINLIIIAAPHSLHSRMIIEAMELNKDIYCEKPPAISMEQLEEIKNMYKKSKSRLYIGYNRRFSKHISFIKQRIKHLKPYHIIYEMNAGFIPKDHWINDMNEGGRLISEACHILDLFVYLNDSKIINVNMNKVTGNSDKFAFNSEATISFTFKNGSIATLLYSGMGNKNYPKETMRIYTMGTIIEMMNYKHTRIIKNSGIKHYKTSGIEKGFKKSYQLLMRAIIDGKDFPIPFEHIYELKHLLKYSNL